MIEAVTRWKTNDGRLHPDEEIAQMHELNRVRSVLDKYTRFSISDGLFSNNDQYKFLLKMIGSYVDAVNFINELNKIIK